jgi:hypothetical protein
MASKNTSFNKKYCWGGDLLVRNRRAGSEADNKNSRSLRF